MYGVERKSNRRRAIRSMPGDSCRKAGTAHWPESSGLVMVSPMSLTPILNNPQYRALIENVLRSACASAGIDVTSVEFAEAPRDMRSAWVCFVVDPRSEDHVAPLTATSAADHFDLVNPDGFLSNAGSTVEITVVEAELASEASISMKGGDGRPLLTSPWIAGLAVAKATFNYRVAAQSAEDAGS